MTNSDEAINVPPGDASAVAPEPVQVVSITCTAASYVSVAFQQNAVPVLHEIKIDNPTDRDLLDVVVTVSSEPAFTPGKTIRIERIGAGTTHHVRAPDLQLDVAFLRRLTEGMRGEFRLKVAASDEEVAHGETPIILHPPSHWGGTQAAPELVAAFVRPNDPAIDIILHDASNRLTNAGKDGAINGYAQGTRERVWEIANAIWAALAARAIVYVLPPASFERTGQKVRSPGDILERKTGTCLDLTLLLASCFEQAGLNGLVVLTEGHAFVGLWLKDEDFSTVAVEDIQTLRKRRDLEDLIFIETTLLTAAQPPRFSVAIAQGAAQLGETATRALDVAVDIKRARTMQIRPLDLGDRASTTINHAAERTVTELDLDEAPAFAEDATVHPDVGVSVDRLEKWKRKLLDLSLRNKMLNFKDAKKAIGIECPDPARLEDLLSEGKKFKLLPRTAVLGEGDQRDAQLFQEQTHDDGRRRFVLDALEKGDVHTSITSHDLESRLTDLYRLGRSAFEEGGANIVFLALGFLKWTPTEGGTPYRAPLLMIPVSLQRSSVRAGFRLALHEDEPRFNPTLLQMLRQDFELKMPELEGELPVDKSGLDVAKIWRIVREHVRDLKGWEVTTDAVISTFSFTKFLIWKDLVDRVDTLRRNAVVRHLIDTPKQSYGDAAPFPEPRTIDRDHHPSAVFAPLSSDSSQLSAVLAAGQGKDFVLFGPPGTGKSQTIANMIAHCLANKKTVLFVAQKTAALEVVQRRLRDIGLGEYCLEVHSTKAQKSAVLGQLKAAWHERAAPTADDWLSATAELAQLRDELNALVSALHRRRPNGLTAHQGFGRVIAGRGQFGELRFDWAVQDHPREAMTSLREICREMRTTLPAVGDPSSHPLKGLAATSWSPHWQRELSTAIDAMIAALDPIEEHIASLAMPMGLVARSDRAFIAALLKLGTWLSQPEVTRSRGLLARDLTDADRALSELAALQSRTSAAREGLDATYSGSVFGTDLRRTLAEWTDASSANFLFRGGKQRKVRQSLEPYASGPLPEDLGRDLVRLIEIRDCIAAADQLGPRLYVFGDLWASLETDTAQCRAAMAWVSSAKALLTSLALPLGTNAAALLATVEAADLDHVRVQTKTLGDVWNGAQAALTRLSGLGGTSAAAATGPDWMASAAEVAQRWKAALGRSQGWCQWTSIADRAQAAGLQPLVTAVESGVVPVSQIEIAFDIAYARGWIDDVVTRDPVLRNFMPIRHDEAIARFRAADDRVRELTKRVVRASLAGGVPAPTAFGNDPEWGTLARELTKRARHMPLRQLFSSIPSALTRLTPCVMMSPLSIAQFLHPSSPPFDLVIFDEASQIPVWDAIGSIARGKQVVIVGDPEQLPPTSVGERGVDDVEDGTDVEDQESILDECLASNIPDLRLDWHYRSRYESLIAFSNKEYYRGRLVTFPSPVTEDRAVRYVNVPGGVYERGKGRVNREEARAVADEVVRRLKDQAFTLGRQSIGVVTFNGEQQRLIENLLDQARSSYPDLERFFDKERWHEPVIVRNLENVQGDERDVILFSVAFAQVDASRPVTTISSLNKEGGHRRLNVAITRARQEMVVYATLRSDQISFEGGKGARGVRDFKHFLEFAERGPRALAEAFAATGEDTESPFEDAVQAALEAKGWEVHPQIGVSGFRVDLGVVDPDAPGRYLAGVECDGASYHRSATARDRDRLRETVLSQLGWRIRRVWSTDWWMDADGALERLQQALEADLAASRQATALAQAAEPAAAPEPEPLSEAIEEPMLGEAPDPTWASKIEDESPESDEPLAPRDEVDPAWAEKISSDNEDETLGTDALEPARLYADAALIPPDTSADVGSAQQIQPAAYHVADVAMSGHQPQPELFYDLTYRPVLRAMVAHVLSVEAPMFDDVLVQRISKAHNFGRAAGRIREVVIGSIDPRISQSAEGDRQVLWPLDTTQSPIAPFRAAPSDVRDHSDVPLPELAGLAKGFLSTGAGKDEAVRLIAREFDLGRLREPTKSRFEAAVELAHSN